MQDTYNLEGRNDAQQNAAPRIHRARLPPLAPAFHSELSVPPVISDMVLTSFY